MDKDSSRQNFENKLKFVTKKRVVAIQKFIQYQSKTNQNEDIEFLKGIDNKPSMTQDDRKEFNQKFSKQYNKLQNLYKKCIQNKNNNPQKKKNKEKITINLNKDLLE